jgi:uncharacterized membrane protein YqiK
MNTTTFIIIIVTVIPVIAIFIALLYTIYCLKEDNKILINTIDAHKKVSNMLIKSLKREIKFLKTQK